MPKDAKQQAVRGGSGPDRFDDTALGETPPRISPAPPQRSGSGSKKGSGPDRYDGRANLNAGTRGKEPGGRFSPAYYESPGKVISTRKRS